MFEAESFVQGLRPVVGVGLDEDHLRSGDSPFRSSAEHQVPRHAATPERLKRLHGLHLRHVVVQIELTRAGDLPVDPLDEEPGSDRAFEPARELRELLGHPRGTPPLLAQAQTHEELPATRMIHLLDDVELRWPVGFSTEHHAHGPVRYEAEVAHPGGDAGPFFVGEDHLAVGVVLQETVELGRKVLGRRRRDLLGEQEVRVVAEPELVVEERRAETRSFGPRARGLEEPAREVHDATGLVHADKGTGG